MVLRPIRWGHGIGDTGSRRPQAKRQERREQIERQLLDATDRLMADGTSFTELSVDRLATEAGISRASFYIYFEDKGDLLRRLARQVFGDLTEDAAQWWTVAGRRDPADIRSAMTRIIASYRRHQPVLIALNEMAGYDAAVGETYRELLTGIGEQFAGVIAAGQDRRIHPGHPARGHHRQQPGVDGGTRLPAEPAVTTEQLR